MWSFIGLEITKFLQKFRNLNNNSEDIFIRWMIVHRKPFNSFIVLNNWIKTFFLEFLPIPTQLIFIMLIEEKKEIFNI